MTDLKGACGASTYGIASEQDGPLGKANHQVLNSLFKKIPDHFDEDFVRACRVRFDNLQN